jgi:acyl-CoA synthetase (NDP forming)
VTALAIDLVTEFDGDTDYTDAVLDIAAESRAPIAVLASVPAAIDPVAAQRLRDAGVPVLEGMRSGLAALGHLGSWPLAVPAVDATADTERQQHWQARITSGSVDPFALLTDYGVPTVASTTAATLDQVMKAARDIGYPVALKTAAAEHKTEVGGVVLGLADEDALRAAYCALAARLGGEVTVSAMARPGVEISVGFVRDDAFGPLVIVAAGGVTVELLGDRAVACPPFARPQARRMLDGLRIRPLLAGWRGSPATDIDALLDVIVGFSAMATELGDILDAVEANPVIVSPDGVLAVDALVIRRL